MKYIKIFLASSIVEFKHERDEFGTFIRRLNNIYAKRNIYFELIVCEDGTKELHNRRMQEVYNDEIKESRYFYIIVGKELGDRSLEEFDVALENYLSNGLPKIMTYFYEIPNVMSQSDSVRDFMERLDKNLGHDYSLFSHFDSIKLDFLMSMHQDPELGADVSFSDGEASLDGIVVMPLINVPIYGKNKSLLNIKSDKEQLDEKFAEIVAKYATNPDDKNLYDELIRISEERVRLADSLRKAEKDILSLCVDVSGLRLSNRRRTWREDRAIQLVNSGDFEGALSILRDKEREKELKQAADIIEGQLEIVKGYIQENLLRIKALRASGLNEERILEIDKCYDEIVELSIRYHVEEESVYKYASFLLDEKNDYDKAISVATELYKTHDESNGSLIEARVSEIIGYAMLVGKHDLELGKKYYEKTIKYYLDSDYSQKWYRLLYAYNMISRIYDLEEDKPKALEMALKCLKISDKHKMYGSDLFHVYLNLADRYAGVNDMTNATIYSDLAYELAAKKLEKNNSDYNRSLLALSCGNKGKFLKREKKYDEAKLYYEKNLLLQKDLSERNPYTSMNGLRIAYEDYGNILMDVYQYNDAGNNYRNAVEYSRKLCRMNPKGEEVFLANNLHNYGNALRYIYNFSEALETHREALNIRKRLIGRDDGYTCDVLYSSRMLADDLSDLEMYAEAEEYYLECVKLAEKCAEEDSSLYARQPIFSKRNLAWFLHETKRYEEARSIAESILKDERNYAKNINDSKKNSLAYSLNCCGCIEFMLKNYDIAEKYLMEGLQIMETIFKGKEKDGFLDLSIFFHNLAECFYRKGDYYEAERYCKKSYEMRKQLYEMGREGMADYMENICHHYGKILYKIGNYDEAASFYTQALSIGNELFEICPEAFRSTIAEIEIDYAKLLIKIGKLSEAKPLAEEGFFHYQKLMAIYEKGYKEDFIEANGIYMEVLQKC